MEEKVWVE